MKNRGLFIAFEGGDGSGKTTQAVRLADRLDAVLTRNPGGTDVGQRLRSILLEGVVSSPRAEALLFMADRAEQIDVVVEPALAAGRHVVCDRFAYSSIAYQGYGRDLDVKELQDLSDWAIAGVWPDVVVFVDVPTDVAFARRGERGDDEVKHFENAEMQRRVIEGFRAMAAEDPNRWVVVDGSGTVEEVEAAIWSAIESRLDFAHDQ